MRHRALPPSRRNRGRWIEASKTGIASSWGQNVDFDRVVSLDKKKWDKKGIAKVLYEDGNRRRRFVIDDFKFKREPTDRILRQLESRLQPEQITGGVPESDDYSAEEPTYSGPSD